MCFVGLPLFTAKSGTWQQLNKFLSKERGGAETPQEGYDRPHFLQASLGLGLSPFEHRVAKKRRGAVRECRKSLSRPCACVHAYETEHRVLSFP